MACFGVVITTPAISFVRLSSWTRQTIGPQFVADLPVGAGNRGWLISGNWLMVPKGGVMLDNAAMHAITLLGHRGPLVPVVQTDTRITIDALSPHFIQVR